MPLYEYQCDACAHRFEVIQKFVDPPIEACPKCGGAVRKLLSSPAIQFKGSGWYITDYARAGKSDGGADTPAKSGTGEGAASGETKGDAKGDAKGETKSATESTPGASATESKPAAPASRDK